MRGRGGGATGMEKCMALQLTKRTNAHETCEHIVNITIQHQVHIKAAGKTAGFDGVGFVQPVGPAKLQHEVVLGAGLHGAEQFYGGGGIGLCSGYQCETKEKSAE